MLAKDKKCWGCLIDFCAWGLIIWGMAYTLNSFVKVWSYWGVYPGFFLFKLVIYRFGITLFTVLVGAVAIYCRKCCDSKG